MDEILQYHDFLLIMMCAEGTTTNGSYLLPFKTGAFLARIPVQPIILKYRYRRLSPAWDTISGVSIFFLLLLYICISLCIYNTYTCACIMSALWIIQIFTNMCYCGPTSYLQVPVDTTCIANPILNSALHISSLFMVQSSQCLMQQS